MIRINHSSQTPKFWWKKEFGHNYYTIYNPQLTPERTTGEVTFIKNVVPLRHNHKILDLGCGHGRHTLELARQQFQITGLDYSDYFLDIARHEAKKQGIQVQFIKQDMRLLDIHNVYDVIISMYSSFGFFPHKENLKLLQHVYAALKPGGKFLIDVINSYGLASKAIQEGQKVDDGAYKTIETYAVDGVSISETNTYLQDSQIGHTHKIWRANNKKGALNLYMIEYTLQQYKHMLETIGFQINNLFGDYDGRRWSKNSWRMIILCQKPTGRNTLFNSLNTFFNMTVKRRWPVTDLT